MSIPVKNIILYTTKSGELIQYHKFISSEENAYLSLVQFGEWIFNSNVADQINIWTMIEWKKWETFNLNNAHFKPEHIPEELIFNCTDYNAFLQGFHKYLKK